MASWYFLKDGEEHGPITSREMKEMADSGRIQPADKVRREKDAEWFPASRVKGLFGDSPKTIPNDTRSNEQSGVLNRIMALLAKRTRLELALIGLLASGVFFVLVFLMLSPKDEQRTEGDSAEVANATDARTHNSAPPATKSSATMQGGAWLTKKSGVSDPLPGLTIYVLPTQVDAAKELEYWETVQRSLEILHARELDEFKRSLIAIPLEGARENVQELQKDQKSQPIESASVLSDYQIYTNTDGFARALGNRPKNDEGTAAHLFALTQFCESVAVAKATVGVDGKYSIQIPEGEYLAFAERRTAYEIVQWQIDLSVHGEQGIQQDFFNDNANIVSLGK
ncbi:MAG: DUF4339 domain-containing protein [Planctomycetaceae bacterium]